MYCTHHTVTGIGNHCFLLCPSQSLFLSHSWSRAVWAIRAHSHDATMSLVSTYVVCVRLSVMHYTFQWPEFLIKNSLSAPTQIFQECWSGVPPPPHENLRRSWHFGFELVWNTPPQHHTTPPPKNENLCRSWHFGFELVWSIPPASEFQENYLLYPPVFHLVFLLMEAMGSMATSRSVHTENLCQWFLLQHGPQW